jgi:hypothetical protein
MTTYYIDGAVGSDANAGTSEGAGNAWATIDKAMNTVAAGDVVYVKASATYNELATIDTLGTYTAPISFIGYSSAVDDDGMVTWTAPTSACLTGGTGSVNYQFRNLHFSGGTSNNVNCSTADYMQFINCKSSGAGSAGFRIDQNCTFINCEAYSNAQNGIYGSGGGRFLSCKIYANGTTTTHDGLLNTGAIALYCLFYANTGQDMSPASTQVVAHCTFDGDGKNIFLLDLASDTAGIVVNNIFHDTLSSAVDGSTSFRQCGGFYGYNLFSSITGSKYDNESSLTRSIMGMGDIEDVPGFSDEAGDDYTLAEDSVARGAGLGLGRPYRRPRPPWFRVTGPT